MATCTVEGCNADRNEGDILFCPSCRDEWIEWCKQAKIHEVDAQPYITNGLLTKFKERLK